MSRKRPPVIGMQLHHQTFIGDAYRHLVGAAQALGAVLERTGEDRYEALQGEVDELVRRVGAVEREVRKRFQKLYEDDPVLFVRCREGYEPWPDEITESFTPRHSCRDRCLYHDHGVDSAWAQCNCKVICGACRDAG